MNVKFKVSVYITSVRKRSESKNNPQVNNDTANEPSS